MLPLATPKELSLDPDRLEHLYEMVENFVTVDSPGSGASIVVGRNGRMAEPKYFGHRGPEADAKPLGPDDVFLLASITKPFTYFGGMLLVERGLMNLTDKVTDFLPEYAANGKGETIVENFFTHTSGLSDMLPHNLELRKTHQPKSKFVQDAIQTSELLFPPGTDVKYQSLGTLLVGHLTELLGGEPQPEFLQRNIFDPLGMTSTRLGTIGFDRSRVVRFPVERGGTDYDWNSKYWHEFGAPWGGAFSCVTDYAVFCAMMLNGGRHGDEQIISPATIQAMTTNRLDDFPNVPEPLRRTTPWGLGWRLKQPGASWGDLMGPRAFGHTGASGTMTWMDPDTGGFFALFTNIVYDDHPRTFIHLSNAAASVFC